MGACEDLARSSGARRIVLSTEREMTAAQALYETLGYTRTPQRDWVINSTTLITYARQLSD